MHPTSLENMGRCIERYVMPLRDRKSAIRVLDLGAADVNGSYRELFANVAGVSFMGADLTAGSGVDLVLADPYRIPMPDGFVDVVVSGQMLEHCEFFWLSFAEMVRVLSDDGVLVVIAPSGGPEHRFPVDCYRFYPDAFRALAKLSGCHVLDLWRDERGPWYDLVGVFSKYAPWSSLSQPPTVSAADPGLPVRNAGPELEVTRGAVPYLEVLARVHSGLSPRLYLEIGVRRGASLELAQGAAIGVDPAPVLSQPHAQAARIETMTSDAFFGGPGKELPGPLDLVFIDGMHLFEFALRDFMHAERLAHPGTLIVIDDVLPNHTAQAERRRRTAHWSGDVWKLAEVLRRRRPELVLLTLDAHPAGLLLVAGLDPSSRVLWDAYNPIVKHYQREDLQPPPRVLRRIDACDPRDPVVDGGIEMLQKLRKQSASPQEVRQAMAAIWKRPA